MNCISKQRTLKIDNESDLQKEVVLFLRENFPKVLFTCTCGGLQDTPQKRINMYEQGYRKGVPDLLIFEPNSSYTGMAIELKTPKGMGVLLEYQLQFMMDLKFRNWKTLISNSYSDIVIQINNYLMDRTEEDGQVNSDSDEDDDISSAEEDAHAPVDCDECGKTFLRQQTFMTHHTKYHH